MGRDDILLNQPVTVDMKNQAWLEEGRRFLFVTIFAPRLYNGYYTGIHLSSQLLD